jgi:hypothetical protein
LNLEQAVTGYAFGAQLAEVCACPPAAENVPAKAAKQHHADGINMM